MTPELERVIRIQQHVIKIRAQKQVVAVHLRLPFTLVEFVEKMSEPQNYYDEDECRKQSSKEKLEECLYERNDQRHEHGRRPYQRTIYCWEYPAKSQALEVEPFTVQYSQKNFIKSQTSNNTRKIHQKQ
jgi:hypothetical protein